ncbi:WD40-repeat-containing domain protein [Dipodascopsis uninucleata]
MQVVRRWSEQADPKIPEILLTRELKVGSSNGMLYSNRSFIKRMDLTHQLYGHSGCINTLCWSNDGIYLLSGSDDTHVNIYTTAESSYPLKLRFPTGHTHNIFSVKFMPQTNNSVVVTAAGDGEVRVFDLQNGSAKRREIYRCFRDQVKRIVPDGNSPHVFLACSEDGDVRQIDMRLPLYGSYEEAPAPLISYHPYQISLNALTMAPSQPQYIVIGGSHPSLFLHDRRFLGNGHSSWGFTPDPQKTTQCVRRFSPRGRKGHHVTSAKFSSSRPNELLGSWSAEAVYLFDIHASPSEDPKLSARSQHVADPMAAGQKRRRSSSGDSQASIGTSAQLYRIEHSQNISDDSSELSRTQPTSGEYSSLDAIYEGNSRNADDIDHDSIMDAEDSATEVEDNRVTQSRDLTEREHDEIDDDDDYNEDGDEDGDEDEDENEDEDALLDAGEVRSLTDIFGDEDGEPWLPYVNVSRRRDPLSAERDVPSVGPIAAYRGHSNVHTIKDVNFYGLNDEYVMSGSDCGHLFIWDRKTCSTVQILWADTETVNVMQPHPELPQLAVSGIDTTVKIFSPYSMDYTPKKSTRPPRMIDAFDTHIEYEEPASVLCENDKNPSSRRKFLGPSCRKISDEYRIAAMNEERTRQGLVDTGFTRHFLADLAIRLRAGGNPSEDGDCAVS